MPILQHCLCYNVGVTWCSRGCRYHTTLGGGGGGDGSQAVDEGSSSGRPARQKARTGGVASDCNNETHSMLSSPKNLIEKYGFRITTPSSTEVSTIGGLVSQAEGEWSYSRGHYQEPDHLRTLAVVALGEGIDGEEDQCAFVNKEFLAAWNPTVAANLLSDKRNLVEEVAFPGPKQNLDALMRCIWPTDHWPLTIAQLKEAIGPSYDWGMHPCLVSAISYYLHTNSSISVVEKLKLAARCGNTLLLSGCLRFHCRRETVLDIVTRSPQEYQEILDSAHPGLVAGKLLEHVARDGHDEYKESLIEWVKTEVGKFKDRCSQLLDFSLPLNESDDGGDIVKDGDELTECCLVVSSSTATSNPAVAGTPRTPSGTPADPPGYYYVNRAYLSCWSPVFHRMFYGDFADRRRQRITLELGEAGEQRYWRLFLTLIHPSFMSALWRLLPAEYCFSSTGRGVTHLNREWIDEAFMIIFDHGGIDAMMHVFRLAHKFQITPLVDFCVLMIEAKSEYTLAEKIMLADAYHLPTLMAWCIGKLTTARSMKRMFVENEHLLDNLSCSTHKILLERMLELV